MRIIRRQKTKPEKSPLDRLRNQVDIFETDGVIYAHCLHQPGTWDIKQCIILDGKNSIYRGMNLYKMEKHKMELEELDKKDLNFLIKDLL